MMFCYCALVNTYNSIRDDESDECYDNGFYDVNDDIDFVIVYDDDDHVIFSSGSL